MEKLENVLEKPWNVLVGIVSATFAVVAGFERELADISLELRFIIVGITCLSAMVCAAEVLATKLSSTAGFTPEAPQKVSALYKAVSVALLLIVAGLSTFLCMKIVTFHNVRILQRVNRLDSSTATIEIQPSHRSTQLTVTLSTSQGGPKVVNKTLGSWNRDSEVSWRMKDESSSGVTLTIFDFISPKVFGVWYQLSGDAKELEVTAESVPEGTRILRDGELRSFHSWILVFGGGLCVVGLFYWLYRSHWFRRES